MVTRDTQQRLDYIHLEEAYHIAEGARGATFPNPIVGAIIAKGAQVISSGCHQKAGEAHAETIAINAASTSLRDSTLYVTLEPCSYEGADKRTPPCVSKILEADIGRVVIGAIDPHERENGRAMRILRKRGVNVVHIDMRSRFISQNEGYVVRVRQMRPLIEVKLAQTADGYSADDDDSSQWISDQGAIRFAHHLRARHDAIMIGTHTALRDNPRLSARFGLNTHPARIVLDRELCLPLSLNIFQNARTIPTYVVHDKNAHDKKKLSLERKGVQRVELSGEQTDFCAQLFRYLYAHAICNSVLVEGGATTISRIMEANMWDKISLIISPTFLLGGRSMKSRHAAQLSSSKDMDLSIWYPLTHFESRCMALRGYRSCAESFGIAGSAYRGDWNV